jgi:hypothetical protein
MLDMSRRSGKQQEAKGRGIRVMVILKVPSLLRARLCSPRVRGIRAWRRRETGGIMVIRGTQAKLAGCRATMEPPGPTSTILHYTFIFHPILQSHIDNIDRLKILRYFKHDES